MRLNPIFDTFPGHITVQGQQWLINTDFRLFIKFIEAVKKKDPTAITASLGAIVGDFPFTQANVQEVMRALSDFMLLVDPPSVKGKQNRPMFDLNFDSDVVYADFARKDIYDIDLGMVEMHWLRFKLLLNGLPENSATEQRKRIRGLDPKNVAKENRSRLAQIQRAYEIPVELDKEQEEALRILEEWSKP